MLRVACVQMEGSVDSERNRAAAVRLVARAGAERAQFVVLPERWECVGGVRSLHEAATQSDETVEAMRGWAREFGVWLVGGSVSEPARESATDDAGSKDRGADGRPAYGHALVVDPWGHVLTEAPGEGEHVVHGDVDLARERLPSLAHRRPDGYA